MVLFAPHDLLKDAPFSRLDLVSCRNLLHLPRTARRSGARSRSSISRCGRTAGCSSALRDRRRRQPTCSRRSTRSTASTSRAWSRERACRRSRRRHAGARAGAAGAQPARQRSAAPGRLRRVPGAAAPSPRGRRHRLVARAAPQADRALRAALGRSSTAEYEIVHLSRARRPLPAATGGEPSQQPAAARRIRRCASSCARRCSAPREGDAPIETAPIPFDGRRRDAGGARSRVAPRRRHRAGLPARHLRRRVADDADAATAGADARRRRRRCATWSSELEQLSGTCATPSSSTRRRPRS